MKKVLCAFFICLMAVSSRAADRFSFSLEEVAGAGVGRGPLFTVTTQGVAQYDLGSGFIAGMGAGIRFAKPCLQYIVKNGSFDRRTFSNELDLPMFLRIGYSRNRFFTNLDGGYALGLSSFTNREMATTPTGLGITSFISRGGLRYNGIFLEPQAGCSIGRHSALALGLLLQHSRITDHIRTDDYKHQSYSTQALQRNIMTPSITLRYAYVF